MDIKLENVVSDHGYIVAIWDIIDGEILLSIF